MRQDVDVARAIKEGDKFLTVDGATVVFVNNLQNPK